MKSAKQELADLISSLTAEECQKVYVMLPQICKENGIANLFGNPKTEERT